MTQTQGPTTQAQGPTTQTQAPARSRIDILSRYWAKIAQSRYSDRKKERLLWESAFFVFEGQYVPFSPVTHANNPDLTNRPEDPDRPEDPERTDP